jgi:hypothetical protein
MSGLPPLETAQLSTAHLVEAGSAVTPALPQTNYSASPQAGNPFSSFFNRSTTTITQTKASKRFSPTIPPLLAFMLFAAVALPTTFLYLVQPHPPTVSADDQKKMAMYLNETRQAQNLAQAQAAQQQGQVAGASTTNANSDVTQANLTSSEAMNIDANVKNKTYAYHLTLSQGFLRKAIELSQQTKTNQTPAQKEEIKKYLDQALESANKAIEADAREGAGFLIRARIYKTSSVFDTKLTEMSDQDLLIARALGIDSNYLDKNQDIYDLLPTQQATDVANAPIIADPESGNDSTVTTQTDANATTGTVTLPAGQTSIKVSAPHLTSEQTLQVSPITGERADGAIFAIQNRNNEGFTISSTTALSHDIALEWRAISL